MTIEELAKQIFAECEKEGEPVTQEEAREMAEMEIGAKAVKNIAKSAETAPKGAKKPRKPLVSAEKQAIFDFLWEGISNYYENCTISIPNKAINLEIGGKKFTINLVEHRK